MSLPTGPDIGHFHPVASLMSRATDPLHTAPVARGAAGSSVRAAAASSGGSFVKDDPFAEIRKRMTAAAEGTEGETKKKLAPMPPDVAVVTEKEEDNPATDEDYKRKAIQDIQHLRDAASIADLYIAMSNLEKRKARGHPDEYRITDPAEAAQAFADMADSAYRVMAGPPLVGLYSFSSGTVRTFSRRMSKTELHLGFLGEIFQGFSLTKAATKQLDGILTNFIKSLGDISVSSEKTNNSVDQTIRIHQTIAMNITGDDDHQVWVYQPRTRIIYMHVDGSTWKWATKKASHEESTFNMRYVVVDCDLNVNKWLAAKAELEAIFKEVTSTTFKDYGKMRFSAPVDSTGK
ncbi:hypothetical protein C7999DRAFT_33862 [Corynascus novoguineensis]|uniref:Uncharacterized protein n=1 Tax=Corynascus novoguineensis TaxID=1126955 RepID=A0AAN7CP98_9PEZI|nr:hypothetical protein C7999DRAFT_33862 [Corynascus novoguineensis]